MSPDPEEQWRESRQLDPVILLAADVADELANLLTPILGYATLLYSSLTPGTRERAQANEIRLAAERSCDFARHLMAIESPRAFTVTTFDLRVLLEELGDRVRACMPRDLALCVLAPDGPVPVRADRAGIEEVVESLVSAVCLAMPDGGAIRLDVRRASRHRDGPPSQGEAGRLGAALVRICCLQTRRTTAQDTVRPATVRSGCGSRPGLRLAAAFCIVRQHGGAVQIDASPRGRTIITVRLPLAR